MAGVDGEELAAGETLVLPALADAVAVGGEEEEGLVLAETLHLEVLGRALGLHHAAVLEHPRLQVLVAVLELRGEHDLGVSVGILPAHDLELLRGDARDAREVVRERLGDGAGGDRVGGLARREAVDLAHLAPEYDALGAHEGPRVGGVAARELAALVVVELDDGAVGEVLEHRRTRVEDVVRAVGVFRPHGHHGVADVDEEVLLRFVEKESCSMSFGLVK